MFLNTPQKSVELFHLLFLRQLNERLDKSLYALKGGCNLRFFFKSIRYSEDIDLDVKTVAKETLRSKVYKLLDNPAFHQTLSSHGIELHQISEAKQTDTTQRWKLGLKCSGISMLIPTKIEFSRRKFDEKTEFEAIDPELIHTYRLYPILVNHYLQETAFIQKVDALIHRSETQARDIFDLELLMNRGVQPQHLPEALRKDLPLAVENALKIDFPAFKAQVVAYLMEEYQQHYNSPQVWAHLQTKVAAMLREAQR